MDRVKTFKLPSLRSPSATGEQEQGPITIVPFPDWMVRKLAAALPGTGVNGLNGPVGSHRQLISDL